VVNKQVAEKAFSVKADELIRKPFQPQDLITRVRHLLRTGDAPAPVPQPASVNAHAALSSIFQQPAKPRTAAAPAATPVYAAPAPAPMPQQTFAPAAAAAAPAPMPARPTPTASAATPAAGVDLQKLKFEIMRRETLVKNLQSDLSAERDYSRALEEHVKTLQEND
jgi:hypothetical protein